MNERFGLADSSESASTVRCGSVNTRPMQSLMGATFFLAAATPAGTDTQTGWVMMVLREIVRSQAAGFVLDLVLWSLFGALLGSALAVVACMVFSRAGWYEMRWRFARSVRRTVFATTGLAAAVLLGLAGFWSGSLHGAERVLTKSQLASGVFPEIGNAIADGMAWIHLHAVSRGNTNEVAMAAALDEFRAGNWELHASHFLAELDGLRLDVTTNFIARLEQSALEHAPRLKGGIGEKLLHKLLGGLGRLLVEKKVASELKHYGADRIYRAIQEQLTTEAAKSGVPETISRRELSEFLVREGIVPGILKPIRSTVRAQQLPLVAITFLVLIAPPLGFRLARSRSGRPNKLAVTPPPAPPISP